MSSDRSTDDGASRTLSGGQHGGGHALRRDHPLVGAPPGCTGCRTCTARSTLVSVVVAVVSLAFAVVARLALGSAVGGMVALSAWSAILAVGSWRLPLVWWSEGRVPGHRAARDLAGVAGLRRIIDRDAISYARVRWSPKLEWGGETSCWFAPFRRARCAAR